MSKKKNKKRLNTDFWRYCNEKSLDNDNYNSVMGQEAPDPKQKNNEEQDFDDFISNVKTKTFSSYFEEDDLQDDDDIFENLQSNRSKTFKSYFDDDSLCEVSEEPKDESNNPETIPFSLVSGTGSLLYDKSGADKPSVMPPPSQTKKDNAKRLTLEEMQKAIVSKVTLITHNGGLITIVVLTRLSAIPMSF